MAGCQLHREQPDRTIEVCILVGWCSDCLRTGEMAKGVAPALVLFSLLLIGACAEEISAGRKLLVGAHQYNIHLQVNPTLSI